LFGPIVSAAPNIQNQQQSQLFAPQPPNLPFSQSSPNFNNVNNDMFSRVFSGTEQINVGTDQRRFFLNFINNFIYFLFVGLAVPTLINFQIIL